MLGSFQVFDSCRCYEELAMPECSVETQDLETFVVSCSLSTNTCFLFKLRYLLSVVFVARHSRPVAMQKVLSTSCLTGNW